MSKKTIIKNSIKSKFLKSLAIIALLFVSTVSTMSYFGSKAELEKTVKNNLSVLSESIYQSMTNSMLSGSTEVVTNAEKHAKELKGIDYINIYKSQKIINDFGLKTKFTDDPLILDIFKSKKVSFTELKEDKHQMKILKPFIADAQCLSCHASAKIGDVLGVMDLRVSLEESDANIAFFTTRISLSNIFLSIVLVGVVLLLLNKLVSNPLQNMIMVIKSLSSGDKDLTKRIKIDTNDELGVIATDFNLYLQSIEDIQTQEKKFIQKAQKTINRVKHGWYDETITAETSSQTLSEFKDSVNTMLTATKDNFNELNSVLEEYTKNNYKAELKLTNIEKDGALEILVKHINELKAVITQMLIENKKSSLTLDSSSYVLLENVQMLNQTSQKTEKSLDDVNNSLKLITNNVSLNNDNVKKMSNLANEVTTSAKHGENLTDQTTIAMDEINQQVTAIHEAITIIDQIAFQTNILSLNAAVEAATAGESGKGFAVVASEVRNLANKSAEAAQQIKELVELASSKTNEGKDIAHQMKKGYEKLNGNIQNTVKYINEIEIASKEQFQEIEQINMVVSKVTGQIKKSSIITEKTKEIAIQNEEMAKQAVSWVDKKEFVGKESIKSI
jgi:methyl-accepting chemotaxis protein